LCHSFPLLPSLYYSLVHSFRGFLFLFALAFCLFLSLLSCLCYFLSFLFFVTISVYIFPDCPFFTFNMFFPTLGSFFPFCLPFCSLVCFNVFRSLSSLFCLYFILLPCTCRLLSNLHAVSGAVNCSSVWTSFIRTSLQAGLNSIEWLPELSNYLRICAGKVVCAERVLLLLVLKILDAAIVLELCI
jgi:hypothetical protein